MRPGGKTRLLDRQNRSTPALFLKTLFRKGDPNALGELRVALQLFHAEVTAVVVKELERIRQTKSMVFALGGVAPYSPRAARMCGGKSGPLS